MSPTLVVSQYTPVVSRGQSPNQVGAIVCVLYHAPGSEPSGKLFQALAKKAIDVRICEDRYAALQILCGLSHEEGVGLGILLLVEPEELTGIGELARLTRTYAPNVVCWVYTAEPSEQVREVRDDDIERWESTVHEHPEPGPSSYERDEPDVPTLRIVHGQQEAARPQPSPGGTAGPAEDDDRADDDEDPANGGSILTDEELAMLLSDDPDEPEGSDEDR